ncbi:hypothetical protein FY524_12860 [Acinetobacter baumannii]|uniref:HIRAN domain-containing protein n=1 Tax=Acinetobacter baumannii TaxID=470 RepID=UPI0011E7E749|nr:HIRAN domain-containing protein [Acinetobacter baumannii]MBF6763343.1 hypothetical protein [Acinetobacter baumannii]MBF6945459.1 HIRAN domain-containing protein [Acinetobacter baumannii]TYR48113.1 hypothetical protein FY524_12860 [Acinetobacter baumannii]
MWTALIVVAIIGIVFYFVKNNKKQGSTQENLLVSSGNPKELIEPFRQNTSLNLPPSHYLAWHKKYYFDVVGESNYQNNLKQIAGGKREKSKQTVFQAILKQEPTNPYDKNAIQVYINGLLVGYLSKETASELSKILGNLGFNNECLLQVNAIVIGGWINKSSEGSYGVRLDLPEDLDLIRNLITTESLEKAAELANACTISSEQKEFFVITGLDIPEKTTYKNFNRVKNKLLKDIEVNNPEAHAKWIDHLTEMEELNAEEGVYEFWTDKDNLEEFWIKKPKKTELKKAVNNLRDEGHSWADLYDSPELVYDELIKINPDLERD